MTWSEMIRCAACGIPKDEDDSSWFSVVEDRWHDTLKILKCDSSRTTAADMYFVCCAAHVQRLVCDWMLTGKLQCRIEPGHQLTKIEQPSELNDEVQLGELMVDREALLGAARRPEMLLAILDAIDVVLEASKGEQSMREEEELVFDA